MKYKAYIIGAILALSLIFCSNRYIEAVKTESYNSGLSVANSAWEKKSREYEDIVIKKKEENSKLAEELRVKSLEKEKILSELKEGVGKKVDAYQNTENGKKSCLDDKFIGAYNDSLGVE